MCAYKCLSLEGKDQQLVVSVLRQGLSLNFELTDLTKLASQWAPGLPPGPSSIKSLQGI